MMEGQDSEQHCRFGMMEIVGWGFAGAGNVSIVPARKPLGVLHFAKTPGWIRDG